DAALSAPAPGGQRRDRPAAGQRDVRGADGGADRVRRAPGAAGAVLVGGGAARPAAVGDRRAHRASGGRRGGVRGPGPGAVEPCTSVWRTLVAGGSPVAVMYDVVHPSIALPELEDLRAEVERGRMVLDVLIDIGVPVTYARTRVMPAVLTARERAGKLLGVTGTTAGLELEELIFAGRDDRVAYSRDLFAPGEIEVMVMRSLDSPRPARVSGRKSDPP